MSKFTEHKDWQPKPSNLRKLLPVCPVCKQEASWAIRDIWSMGLERKFRYKFRCRLCGAEWGAVPLRPFQLGSGIRVLKFPHLDSIVCLLDLGEHPQGDFVEFLNKEMKLREWLRFSNRYCEACGAPISDDMKFCPKCGARINTVCPFCGENINPNWQYCPFCKKKLDEQK